MPGITRPAARDELAGMWPVVSTAHLFDDSRDFVSWWEDAPWRVRLTRSGEPVILGRWREHMDLLAVRGIWCPEPRIPILLEDLRDVARENGFLRLLGPLVPEEAARAYLAAGMEVTARVVVYRRRATIPAATALPDGVTMREAGAEDMTAVASVDAECFDDFWRYDPARLAHYAEGERVVVADRAGRPIGYTLSSTRGSEATIGRLAVAGSERGCGIGASLLVEAMRHAARNGAAAVTLCTQEGNEVSRRLYRRAGFRELPGRLVATVSRPV